VVVGQSKEGARCEVTEAERCQGEVNGNRAVKGLCDRYKCWYECTKCNRRYFQRKKIMLGVTSTQRQAKFQGVRACL